MRRRGRLGVSLAGVLPRTAERLPDGRLAVGGCALADVAAEHGTPALRGRRAGPARDRARVPGARSPRATAATDVHFASKALPVRAGHADPRRRRGSAATSPRRASWRSRWRPDSTPRTCCCTATPSATRDLAAALAAGVGLIVIDGPDDVDRLARLAPARPAPSSLRVNPAVPGVTHAAMDTGSAGGQVRRRARRRAARCSTASRPAPGLELRGLHVHIGSQLLDLDGFGRAAAALAALGALPRLRPRRRPRDRLHAGGRARRRSPTTPTATVGAAPRRTSTRAARADRRARPLAGRPLRASRSTRSSPSSAARDARRGRRRHGRQPRADALRPALRARDRSTATAPAETCELVGHHCESGDVLVGGVALATPRGRRPRSSMPATGAYCYSLQNNYNGTPRHPGRVCRGRRGAARGAARDLADLLARDLLALRRLRAAVPTDEEERWHRCGEQRRCASSCCGASPSTR